MSTPIKIAELQRLVEIANQDPAIGLTSFADVDEAIPALLRLAVAAKAFIDADDNFGVYYGDDRDIEATDRFRATDDELRAALTPFDFTEEPSA